MVTVKLIAACHTVF